MKLLKNKLFDGMRKRIYVLSLFCTLFVLGLMLTACYESVESLALESKVLETSNETTQLPPYSIPNEEIIIQIALASDELLINFDYLHEFDYSEVLVARIPDESIAKYTDGYNLVLWANRPFLNFAVVSIGHDFINDELFFIPIDSFGLIDELLPGEAFIVTNYWGMGMFPWSGVTFVDENGTNRYFMISQNQAYPDGSGNLWDIGEFHNRNDELPEDWQPWW